MTLEDVRAWVADPVTEEGDVRALPAEQRAAPFSNLAHEKSPQERIAPMERSIQDGYTLEIGNIQIVLEPPPAPVVSRPPEPVRAAAPPDHSWSLPSRYYLR